MINNDKYFECKSCNFKCYKKSNYEAHLNTLKHKNNTQFDKLICSCGKSYKHPSGLYRHKKICSFIQQQETIPNKDDQKIDKLVGLVEKTMETIGKVLEHGLINNNTVNNNTVNNTVNNNVNINLYLNENCKDAISMEKFLEQISVKLEHLLVTKQKGINEGIANIFLDNINKLSVHERPVHCTDPKRETVYIKHDKWEKDVNSEGLKKALTKISNIQSKQTKIYEEDHPNFMENEDERDEYIELINSTTKDLDFEKSKGLKKIYENIHLSKEERMEE
jgi:hypothetical protein